MLVSVRSSVPPSKLRAMVISPTRTDQIYFNVTFLLSNALIGVCRAQHFVISSQYQVLYFESNWISAVDFCIACKTQLTYFLLLWRPCAMPGSPVIFLIKCGLICSA